MYSLTRRCRFCATSTYKIGLMTYDQQMNNASGPKTRKSTKYRTDGAFTKLLSHVDRTRRLEDLRSFDFLLSQRFAFRGVLCGWCFRRTSKLYKNDHVIEDDDDYRNRLGSMEANNRGNDSDTAMPPSSSTAIWWAMGNIETRVVVRHR